MIVREAQTDAMRALHRADPAVVVWWATRVECVSAITRLVREGRLESVAEGRARAELDLLLGPAEEVLPIGDVRQRAERCLAVHPLRAADALQLGAALIWARERPAGIAFVSLDARLRTAAQREGFTILPAGP
jgi:predicted nucleic acid-binding protein